MHALVCKSEENRKAKRSQGRGEWKEDGRLFVFFLFFFGPLSVKGTGLGPPGTYSMIHVLYSMMYTYHNNHPPFSFASSIRTPWISCTSLSLQLPVE